MSQGSESDRSPSPSQWVVTGGLLLLTAVMVAVAAAGLSKPLRSGVLLGAMTIQVWLIAGYSMRLRRAHSGIVWTFIGGLVLTGLLLYSAIAPDAIRIHRMWPLP